MSVREEIWESFEWLLVDDLKKNDMQKFNERLNAMWSELTTCGVRIPQANEFLIEKFKLIGYTFKPRGRKNAKARQSNRQRIGA